MARKRQAASPQDAPTRPVATAPDAAFEVASTAAIGELRRRLGDVIDALPGPVSRASELQHALGIDKALGWRVYNAVQCNDSFAAARFLPGAAGIRSFLVAARRSGVSKAITSQVSDAQEQLDRVIKIHAGDRKRFDMLVAAHTREGRHEADLLHRRAAYEGNTYVWGSSAQVQLRTAFLAPSAKRGYADMANLRGLIGLELLRPALRWPLGLTLPRQDDLRTSRKAVVEPLFDVTNASAEEAELFLSDPGIRIETRVTDEGGYQYDVVPSEIGLTGAVSCVMGDVVRPVGALSPEEGSAQAGAMVNVSCPARLLIFDFLVHRDLFGGADPEVQVRGDLGWGRGTTEHRLPVTERSERIGLATDVVRTPEVPGYDRMRDFVFDRLEWDPSKFVLHRLRLEYPILSSIVTLEYSL